MSKFYGEVITDTSPIDTAIRISKNANVKYIRAHILRQGLLIDGSVQMSIYEGATLLKAVELDYTELNGISEDTYAHGWFRFDFDVPLHHNYNNTYTEYTIRLEVKSMTNKILWLASDLNDPIRGLHNTDSIYARGFEIYTSLEF